MVEPLVHVSPPSKALQMSCGRADCFALLEPIQLSFGNVLWSFLWQSCLSVHHPLQSSLSACVREQSKCPVGLPWGVLL